MSQRRSRRKNRGPVGRALRVVRHAIFDASRQGRTAEITGWSNALASLGLGGLGFFLTASWQVAVVTPIVAFILLRVALVHRHTLWIPAALGTVAVSGVAGFLAWLFAHVAEVPWLPSVAAVVVALVSATAPAWAYGRLAQRRTNHVRDSLIDPVSVPSSW
jgi:hypothetical protein